MIPVVARAEIGFLVAAGRPKWPSNRAQLPSRLPLEADFAIKIRALVVPLKPEKFYNNQKPTLWQRKNINMHYVSSEALLEMYFLQGTLNELGAMFGKCSLKLIKPSPQDEKWIGIDQAWVSTVMTDDEFLANLKSTVSNGGLAPFYFAVFRQYKRVEEISRASKYTPYLSSGGRWKRPYYRCDIYTQPGQEVEGLKRSATKKCTPQPKYSQHEALIRLSNIKEADVHYACPMIFDPIDVWKKPDMNEVRLVPVRPNQPTYAGDQDLHHLCFQTKDDPSPEYHSEERVVAQSISLSDWIGSLSEINEPLDAKRLLFTLLAADILLAPQTEKLDFEAVAAQAKRRCEGIWDGPELISRLARHLTDMLTIIEVSPTP